MCDYMEHLLNSSKDNITIEKYLKETHHFAEKILATTPSFIYVYDLNRKYNIYTNYELMNFLGYTSEEVKIIGSNFLKIIIHPEDIEKITEYHKHITYAPDGEIFSLEYRIRHSDGSWKWICTRDTVFKRDSTGMVEQIIGTATDITDKKIAEEEKEKIEKQLQQAQKMESIGTIAGGIAHDFNNILGTIISYSELGLRTISDENSVRNSFEGIIKAGYRARDIIRQILSSELNKGSSFQILIPEFQNQVIEKDDSQESGTSEHVHILFIDDEEDLLFSQGQMLKFQGYNVTSTTSSTEALEIFQKNPYDFDLLITDQTMPDMTGIEIVKKVFHIRPEIPVILCTGYSDQSIEDEAEALGIKSLIIKPVTAKNLIKTIKKMLER